MIKKFGFVMLTALVIVFAGCSVCNAIEAGNDAPYFTLKDINGNSVDLKDHKGEVVILDFFASWCPPCRQEVPDFIKLQGSYSSEGFTVIGVALVSLDEAKGFASQQGINYPVLIDDGKASAVYGPVRSIPTTFVINKDGKVVNMYIGGRDKATFEKDIKEMLAKERYAKQK